MSAVDQGAARRFLAVLDPEAESFTFQTFTDAKGKRGPDPLARVLHGAFDRLVPELEILNSKGAGIYVTVNETDLKGRGSENVTRVRAVWQEDDGKGKPIPLEAQIEVETSPGHAHRYLLCDGLDASDHRGVQERLIADYGSDPNAKDLPRVLRLPGFYHRSGHQVRLVHAEQRLPYTRAQILAALPPLGEAQAKPTGTAETATDYATDAQLRELREALAWIPADDRAVWVAMGNALRNLGSPGRGLWLAWSQSSEKWNPADAQDWYTFKADRTGYAAVFAEAQRRGWPNPAAKPKVSQDEARKAHSHNTAPSLLPAFPDELLALPHGLGELQRWILGYMTYPSPACAGFAAIATLAHFAMARTRIDSQDGLGLNEHFLLLAPTGFGKEDLRKPFAKLTAALEHATPPPGAGNLWRQGLPSIQYSAPASQQGLHRLLEKFHAQTFLADEFAEWLVHSKSDSHKQQALGHFMQAYSKAFGTLAAPAVADKERGYVAVEGPRVQVFATSTAERMLEAITTSHADSGALNRFLILVAEQGRIPKRYGVTAAAFDPPPAIVALIAWIAAREGDKPVTFDPDALEFRDAHDAAVIEPLKFSDPRLAGRLYEQAIKLAALIALSDRRAKIGTRDMAIAYAVREGLYHRAASLIGHDGALSGMHPTGQALEQLRARFCKAAFLYRSNLPKESRRFAALSVPERQAVERALVDQGIAKIEGGRYVSQIHDMAA